jgi:hypothetical protein
VLPKTISCFPLATLTPLLLLSPWTIISKAGFITLSKPAFIRLCLPNTLFRLTTSHLSGDRILVSLFFVIPQDNRGRPLCSSDTHRDIYRTNTSSSSTPPFTCPLLNVFPATASYRAPHHRQFSALFPCQYSFPRLSLSFYLALFFYPSSSSRPFSPLISHSSTCMYGIPTE